MIVSMNIVDKANESGKVIVRTGEKVITITKSESGGLIVSDGGALIIKMSYHQALIISEILSTALNHIKRYWVANCRPFFC